MTDKSPPIVGPIWKVALGGTAAIGVAAVFDVFRTDSPTVIAIRVMLTIGGLLAVGIACYLRPGHAKLYGLACGAAILSRFGFPPQWDSAVIFSGLAAVVAGLGALLMLMPVTYRKIVASLLVVLHFGGILSAVTSPMSPPWTSMAVGVLFYRPYLQTMYLTNAYHFYSPEPGPASQMWFCVKYKPNAKGEASVKWLKFPRRPDDMFDPLALTYYRRLSLTMRIEDFQPGALVTDEMKRARILRSTGDDGIPIDPERIPLENQYVLPTDGVRDFILPSYVRHVAAMPDMEHPEGLPIESIKVYRVTHRILSPQLLQKVGPYDPATYQPFYLGEFDTTGRLTDPSDPLLYWMVPIIWEQNPKYIGEINPWDTPRDHPEKFILIDGVARQTGTDHNKSR